MTLVVPSGFLLFILPKRHGGNKKTTPVSVMNRWLDYVVLNTSTTWASLAACSCIDSAAAAACSTSAAFC